MYRTEKIKVLLSDFQRFWIAVGILGSLTAFIFGAGFYASTLPWRGTGDSAVHLDYVWQISHGDLPQFWEGTNAPIGRKIKVQFVSNHPPLYYSILAPFVGPRIDAGDWQMGVAIGRIITIFIGALSVLAFAWAGWVLGGKYKALMAVTLPAIATSLVPYVKVSGDIMNDTLSILAGVIALTLAALIIRKGPNKKYLIWLSLACLTGMASKVSFISVFALSLFAVPISVLLHNNAKLVQKLLKSAALVTLILVVVTAGIGWFYYRNYQLSGSPHRTAPQSWAADLQGRRYKSLEEVVTHPKLWTAVPQRLYGNPWRGGDLPAVLSNSTNIKISGFIFVVLIVSAMYNSLKKLRTKNYGKPTIFIGMLFSLQVVLIYLQQISHATGYGSINIRYFLPILLPLGLVFSYGLLFWQKLRGMPVMLLICLNWLMVVGNSLWFMSTRYDKIPAQNPWARLVIIAEQNGLSTSILFFIIAGLMLGIATTCLSIWKLSATTKKDKLRFSN
jgi:hypothetical protein